MGRNPGTVLLAVGALLLLGVVVGGGVLWDTDFVHHRMDASTEFNQSQEGHLRYENLSERGKEIVDRTVENDEYTVGSESETAADFEYPTDYNRLGTGWYVIQRDGRTYEITTNRDSPGLMAPMLTMLVLLPLAMVGSAVLAFGAYRRHSGASAE